MRARVLKRATCRQVGCEREDVGDVQQGKDVRRKVRLRDGDPWCGGRGRATWTYLSQTAALRNGRELAQRSPAVSRVRRSHKPRAARGQAGVVQSREGGRGEGAREGGRVDAAASCERLAGLRRPRTTVRCGARRWRDGRGGLGRCTSSMHDLKSAYCAGSCRTTRTKLGSGAGRSGCRRDVRNQSSVASRRRRASCRTVAHLG